MAYQRLNVLSFRFVLKPNANNPTRIKVEPDADYPKNRWLRTVSRTDVREQLRMGRGIFTRGNDVSVTVENPENQTELRAAIEQRLAQHNELLFADIINNDPDLLGIDPQKLENNNGQRIVPRELCKYLAIIGEGNRGNFRSVQIGFDKNLSVVVRCIKCEKPSYNNLIYFGYIGSHLERSGERLLREGFLHRFTSSFFNDALVMFDNTRKDYFKAPHTNDLKNSLQELLERGRLLVILGMLNQKELTQLLERIEANPCTTNEVNATLRPRQNWLCNILKHLIRYSSESAAVTGKNAATTPVSLIELLREQSYESEKRLTWLESHIREHCRLVANYDNCFEPKPLHPAIETFYPPAFLSQLC